MKSLFDKESYEEINRRINALSLSSQRQWGKMEVAQMLAHCKAAFRVPLSDKKIPRSFLGLMIGWMIKSKLYNDDPWKKNLPTAPEFKISGEKNFEKERQELSGLINTFTPVALVMWANFHIRCLVRLPNRNGDRRCTNI